MLHVVPPLAFVGASGARVDEDALAVSLAVSPLALVDVAVRVGHPSLSIEGLI